MAVIKFKTKINIPRHKEWCIVKVPNYCPSGFHVAQYNEIKRKWEDEYGDTTIHEYIGGWDYIKEPEI